MMILLPGILSQGGEKLTWKKYTVGYTAVAGTAASASRTYSNSKMAATSYDIANGVFTLNSPAAKTFENLTSDDYVTDIADSASTAISGSTVYGIQSNSRDYTVNSASSTNKYSVSGETLYFFRSYTIENGKFVLSGSASSASADDFYGSGYTSASNPTSKSQAGSYSTIYTMSLTGQTNDSGYTIWTATTRKLTLSEANTVTIGYTPYTASAIRGTYIGDVKAKPGTYPDNGIKDGYWYALQQDGFVSVVVNSSDNKGYLSALIETNGSLTVGGVTITQEQQTIQVPAGDIEIVYTLNTSISTARTLYVDGVSIGSASAAGTVLRTTVYASTDGQITIEFKG